MQRKDVLELRKRFRKGHFSFTNMSGCYVNADKEIVSKFNEFFLNLDEEELLKYLEIAKKVLSGNIGNNVLKLDFPLDENFTNERQTSLLALKNSKLKDEALLDDFYHLVIDRYDYEGNFLILLFHDAYDIMTKTTDNRALDDSLEVFDYILCAICPVALSAAGLTYFEPENAIKSRIRDWVVGMPNNGFVFPAFVNRSADVNSSIYYTRRPKDPHPELMEDVLGCNVKYTSALQKDTFQAVVTQSLDVEEEQAERIFTNVQENLNTMVEDYNALYDDTDYDPITLSENHIQDLLEESGIPQEATAKIESTYAEIFDQDLPLAENLLDKKILKENAQAKKEQELQKQVNTLETKLREVTSSTLIEADDEDENMPDIVLHVKPEKVPEIKSQIVDGQNYLLIPINDNEQARVNGADDLI